MITVTLTSIEKSITEVALWLYKEQILDNYEDNETQRILLDKIHEIEMKLNNIEITN